METVSGCLGGNQISLQRMDRCVAIWFFHNLDYGNCYGFINFLVEIASFFAS